MLAPDAATPSLRSPLRGHPFISHTVITPSKWLLQLWGWQVFKIDCVFIILALCFITVAVCTPVSPPVGSLKDDVPYEQGFRYCEKSVKILEDDWSLFLLMTINLPCAQLLSSHMLLLMVSKAPKRSRIVVNRGWHIHDIMFLSVFWHCHILYVTVVHVLKYQHNVSLYFIF